MEDYLKSTRSYLNDLSRWQKIHVVMGNEACDLDSTVSSLLYAYLLSKLNNNSEIAVLPVLNTNRSDIHLKTEIKYLLKENDIDITLPICRNEIDLKVLQKKEKLLLTLVDHNSLSKPDKDLISSVVEIIDHHKKGLDHFDENCEITIEMVGSCATLIADKIFVLQSSLLEKQTASLLYGTIVLDTVCFEDSAGRVTDKDKDIAEQLKQFLPETVDPHQLFNDLQEAKFDISGFTVEDLLRKDLKVVTNSVINIAVASIPLLVQELTKKENLETELKTFNSNRNYHTLVIMGIHLDKMTKEIKRDIGIYSINHVCKQQVADYLASVASLQLVEMDVEIQCLSLYQQGNVTASRKVILPLLQSFLFGENSEELQNHPMKMQLQDISQKDTRISSCDELPEMESSENSEISVFTPPNGILPSASSYLLGFGDPLSLPISSQNSSNQNSCPYTPQNSYVDEDFEVDPYEKQLLPSFNSREMMEKIETKRGKLHGYEGETYSENYPFTPKNSYVDSNFDTYAKQLPSFECDNFLQKVQEKKAVLEELVREEDDKTSNKYDNARSPFISVNSVPLSSSESDQSKGTVICQHQKENSLPMPRLFVTKPSGTNEYDSSGKLKIKKDDISPEDNSLASSQGEKGDERMDISTSGSDKDSGSPATAPANDIKDVNSDVNSKNTKTRVTTSASAYTSTQEADSDLAFNYQAETVDFPDSPRHMKLMAHLSSQDLTANCLDDLAMNQDEDDVLRTVLSPETDDSHSKKGEDYCSTDSLKEELTSSEEYFEDNFILDNSSSQEGSQVSGSFSPILHSTKCQSSMEIHGENLEENGKMPIELVDFVTLKKIRACFDQEKIKGLYSLSGRLQDLLTQGEIEELLSKSENYLEFIDDELFEALHNARTPVVDKQLSLDKTNVNNNEKQRVKINANIDAHIDDDDDNDWKNEIKVNAIFEDFKTNAADFKKSSVLTNTKNYTYAQKILSNNLVAIFEESNKTNNSPSSRKIIHAASCEYDSNLEDSLPSSIPSLISSVELTNENEKLPCDSLSILKTEMDSSLKSIVEIVNLNVSADDKNETVSKVTTGRPLSLNTEKKKIIKVNPDILNASENDEDAKSLSSLSNKSGDLLSPVDDLLTPVDIETPDELEDSILERLASVSDPIPEFSAAEEYDEERSWRTCVIAGVQRKIDMKVIEPYKKVLSHGGYCVDTQYAIIVFSACYLPDRSRRDYDYVMDNLFLYVLTTLDQLVADDYLLIYLHGATERSNLPSFGWLKRCYQMIDRRLRKNLKGLYLVHPTFWLKTIVLMTKPFISSKFSRKLRFISSLKELAEQIPMDHLSIPEKVKQLEFELMIKEKKKRLRNHTLPESNKYDDRLRFGL